MSWLKNLWASFTQHPTTSIGGLLGAAGLLLPQIGVSVAIAHSIAALGVALAGASAASGSATPAQGPVDISPVDLASQNLIAGVLQTALAQHQANNAPPAAK